MKLNMIYPLIGVIITKVKHKDDYPVMFHIKGS
jgi:hypothetical protein